MGLAHRLGALGRPALHPGRDRLVRDPHLLRRAGASCKTLAYHVGWHSFPTLGYTLWAVVIGEIWVNVPFGVLMMSSGLNSVPNALIEAARDSGASLPRTVRSVLLPMNVIPTVIVATFTGIYVLGSFTVPYLTGPSAPNLLGVSMSNFFTSFNQPQQAEVMAMIVFVLAAGIGADLRLGERPRVEARRRSTS